MMNWFDMLALALEVCRNDEVVWYFPLIRCEALAMAVFQNDELMWHF